MNKKMIRYIVGSIIMLEAALLLLPILTAIVYGEWNTLRVFAGSALFCIVAGALLRGKKPENTRSVFHSPYTIAVRIGSSKSAASSMMILPTI